MWNKYTVKNLPKNQCTVVVDIRRQNMYNFFCFCVGSCDNKAIYNIQKIIIIIIHSPHMRHQHHHRTELYKEVK